MENLRRHRTCEVDGRMDGWMDNGWRMDGG